MVVCLERDADLHMAQLVPLPLTVSCFSKIHIGVTFLIPAHSGSPGKRAVKRVCVCVCVFVYLYFPVLFCLSVSVKWLAVKTTSEMTYIVSSGALNSTPTSNCGCGFGGGWSCVVDRCCIIQHCSMWDTIDLALSLAWDSLWSLSNHSRYFIMLTIQWVLNKAGVKRELLDTVKARKLAYYGHTMRK